MLSVKWRPGCLQALQGSVSYISKSRGTSIVKRPPFTLVFQDIHVMIFLGIGFLLTYMKRYSLSSVGFVLFIGAVCVQWGILVAGFLHLDHHHGRIVVNINTWVEQPSSGSNFISNRVQIM